jgi:DNA-binding winged helix-turn-helix (wHTH) protein
VGALSTSEPAVRLSSCGGLRMWRSGVEVDIGAPRLRTLLAALPAARGGVVGTTGLIDLIWGAEPSPSAVNQLHRLIGQVRRLFEPDLPSRAAGRRVQPAGQGYRLIADARACDLIAVRDLVATARAAAAAGRTRATDLALAGPDGPRCVAQVQRIAASPVTCTSLSRPAWCGCSRPTADAPRRWRCSTRSVGPSPTSSAPIPARSCGPRI